MNVRTFCITITSYLIFLGTHFLCSMQINNVNLQEKIAQSNNQESQQKITPNNNPEFIDKNLQDNINKIRIKPDDLSVYKDKNILLVSFPVTQTMGLPDNFETTTNKQKTITLTTGPCSTLLTFAEKQKLFEITSPFGLVLLEQDRPRIALCDIYTYTKNLMVKKNKKQQNNKNLDQQKNSNSVTIPTFEQKNKKNKNNPLSLLPEENKQYLQEEVKKHFTKGELEFFAPMCGDSRCEIRALVYLYYYKKYFLSGKLTPEQLTLLLYSYLLTVTRKATTINENSLREKLAMGTISSGIGNEKKGEFATRLSLLQRGTANNALAEFKNITKTIGDLPLFKLDSGIFSTPGFLTTKRLLTALKELDIPLLFVATEINEDENGKKITGKKYMRTELITNQKLDQNNNPEKNQTSNNSEKKLFPVCIPVCIIEGNVTTEKEKPFTEASFIELENYIKRAATHYYQLRGKINGTDYDSISLDAKEFEKLFTFTNQTLNQNDLEEYKKLKSEFENNQNNQNSLDATYEITGVFAGTIDPQNKTIHYFGN